MRKNTDNIIYIDFRNRKKIKSKFNIYIRSLYYSIKKISFCTNSKKVIYIDNEKTSNY